MTTTSLLAVAAIALQARRAYVQQGLMHACMHARLSAGASLRSSSGASSAVNFVVCSRGASAMALILARKPPPDAAAAGKKPGGCLEIALDPVLNRTGDLWHIAVQVGMMLLLPFGAHALPTGPGKACMQLLRGCAGTLQVSAQQWCDWITRKKPVSVRRGTCAHNALLPAHVGSKGPQHPVLCLARGGRPGVGGRRPLLPRCCPASLQLPCSCQ